MLHTERCFNLVDWQVDPALNRLMIDEQTFELEPRVMQVLVCLYDHAEELVSKDDLLDEVWHGVSITDDAIYCSISKLRKTFRQVEEHRSPQLKTITRQGYMLSLSPAYQVLTNGFNLNQNISRPNQNGFQFGRRHDDKVVTPSGNTNGANQPVQKNNHRVKKAKRLAKSSELKPIKLKFFVDTQKIDEQLGTRQAKYKLKIVMLVLWLVLLLQSLYIVFM